jgi:hypothetical protein
MREAKNYCGWILCAQSLDEMMTDEARRAGDEYVQWMFLCHLEECAFFSRAT